MSEDLTWNSVLYYLADKILGPLIWLAVAAVAARAIWLFRQRRSRSFLIGSWFSYHWTFINERPTIVQGELEISFSPASLRASLRFELLQRGTLLRYRGDSSFEGDHLLLTLKSKDFKETTVIRLDIPLESKGDIIPGFWLGFNHDKKLSTGALLLCRNQQPEEFIDSKFIEKFLPVGVSLSSKVA
jgi:hypothetical protein